jgi:hypothetical protein
MDNIKGRFINISAKISLTGPNPLDIIKHKFQRGATIESRWITLIQSGGGNEPDEARQPRQQSEGANSRSPGEGLADKGGNETTSLPYRKGFYFLPKSKEEATR